MDEAFLIFVERLKEGKSEVLNEHFSPSFLEVDEEELAFEEVIHLEGEAFVSGDAFVVTGKLRTRAKMPCAICNALTEVDLEVVDFAHTEKVEEIKSGVFHLAPLLREALLLELPSRAECSGACPQREAIKKYLAKGKESFPFENLGEE